tara:strand:+ start:298 stop:429 length:132 start_codon:yes stop_codon:yes gene_type:complete
VAYHLWLDIDFNEVLSIVDSYSLTDEFRQDWDVTAMRADCAAS